MAKAHSDVHKDPSTHTVACTFTIVPGEQFRLASVDSTSLPPAAQSRLTKLWHPAVGTLMDQSLQTGLAKALHQLPSSLHVITQYALDATNHTDKIILHARETPHS